MPFFSKLKQKMFGEKLTNTQKNYLAVLSVICFFAFFTPHTAHAAGIIETGITWLLEGVLKFVGLLLNMAETIFQWIINPANMKALMDNAIVYETWRTVRDIFNIAFIMVLLFSAFATIFQASTNYNYKKVLLNLIIMALLVNFSYPIARFIIDVSNMMMYGFLNNLGGSGSFMIFTGNTGLNKIITTPDPDLSYLLAAIVFTFILAVTLLVIAILLVIRAIALTIYIIFSPLAFVGQIAPGTKLASIASDWWKDFMQQCFAGPTIVFMLFVSTKMFSAITTAGGSMNKIALTQASNNTSLSGIITAASFFSIPIIILWYGIILAQKSGIAGAGAVVGAGMKAINWAKNAPHRTAWWAAKKTGVPGGVQQKWANWKKTGYFGSDRQAEREAKFAGKGPFAVKGSLEKDMRKKAEEYKKNLATDTELKTLAAAGDAAAALRLAEDKKMDQTTYDAFTLANTNTALRGAINAKVRQNRNDLVAINKSNDADEQAKAENISGTMAANQPAAQAAFAARATAAGLPPIPTAVTIDQHIANQQMGTLSAEQWNDQDWTATINQPAGPNRNKAILAAQTAWANLKPEARAEVRKRLSGNNSAALSSIGIV